MRVERDPEDRLGGGEGYIGHPDDTAGFENVVRLEDVGVEHQRVGLATSASVRARDKEREDGSPLCQVQGWLRGG